MQAEQGKSSKRQGGLVIFVQVMSKIRLKIKAVVNL